MSIWVKIYKYLEFGKNCSKISILVNIYETLDLVKVYENLDFGQNCRKIFILVNIFGKSGFLSISSVKSIWVKIFPKSWLC